MSKLILVGLLAVWAIVLFPDLMARLGRTRRGDTIGSFSSQIRSLGNVNRSSHSRSGLSDSPMGFGSSSLGPSAVNSGSSNKFLSGSLSSNVIDIRSKIPSLAKVQNRSASPSAVSPAPTASNRSRGSSEQLQSRGASASSFAPTSVRRRRQDVLTILCCAAILTLLATVAFGGPFLMLHLIVDMALVAYLLLLAQATAPAASGAQRAPSRPESFAPIGPVDGLHAAAVTAPSVAEPHRIAN